MNDSERIAKSIVEHVLPGSIMAYRTVQHDGSHDFDLTSPSLVHVPVEVTRSVAVPRVHMRAALKDHGHTLERIRAQQNWIIVPSPDANIRRIRQSADEFLRNVEEDGVGDFHPWLFDPPLSVVRIRDDLRIEGGKILSYGPPRIEIAFPGISGRVSAANGVEAVDLELAKNDNRRKLAATAADERHLFVYVDPLNFLPWYSIRSFDPETFRPALPPEITDVWAAAGPSDEIGYAVWRGSRDGWKALGTVRLA
jgi:hypothetical protein